MSKYKCIKAISYNNITFNVNDIVVIVNENKGKYLVADEFYYKGFSIQVKEFENYFLKI